VTANSFARDVNEDLSRFVKLFQAGDVVETFGKRMRFEILEKFGEGMKAREDSELKRMSYVKQGLTSIEYHEPIEESIEEKRPEEEEEEREERRWEKREQTAVKEAMRPAVSEAQRQFAPTFSYAPAQPRLSAQTTISPQAQPIREKAQPQPVQLDETSVLSAVLMKFFPKQDLETALHFVFSGKGIDVKLDYNAKKALEESGLAKKELEIDIRYTNVNREFTIPVGNGYLQLRTRVHVPVVWNKYCPNCGHLIVLSPTRCVFCGEVVSPLPYVVSYKPAGT
jgi:hypothetical protein